MTEIKKPFEIELHSVGTVLIGRILYQDDTRITRGVGRLYKDDRTGFEILTSSVPAISPAPKNNYFYIRGTDRKTDCKYFVFNFCSEKEMLKYVEELKAAIANFEIEIPCTKKKLDPTEMKKLI